MQNWHFWSRIQRFKRCLQGNLHTLSTCHLNDECFYLSENIRSNGWHKHFGIDLSDTWLSDRSTKDMTSQHNYLTSRNQDVTSRHNYLTRGDRTLLHTYPNALISTGFHLKCSTPYSSGQFWLFRSYSKTLLSTVRYILTIFFNALNSYIQSPALYGRCNILTFLKKK